MANSFLEPPLLLAGRKFASRLPNAYIDLSGASNGAVPALETGQAMQLFGNSPFTVSGGRIVHTQVPSTNSAGYGQVTFDDLVTEVVMDVEFPAASGGAAVIVLPSGETGWGGVGIGVTNPAGVHFVLYGNGRYRLAYWTGSAETLYRTGIIPDMRDGQLRKIAMTIDHANNAVSILMPNGETITHVASTIGQYCGKHAVFELFENVVADAPAKFARLWAATEKDKARRARPGLGDIARAVDFRTASLTSSIAELTNGTSTAVNVLGSYNSTIRKTIMRPPSGKVAVTIEAFLTLTAATRVFFRCGQETVGGTTQGAQGTVEEVENFVTGSVVVQGRRSATGLVTIPDNVSQVDIVGSISRAGGTDGDAKYILDSTVGRRVRMLIVPVL
ncbi:MAG: hypothetical protein WBD41_14395 [Rhodococcus sp. (in: high G+C Gram-positive bacteria)]